jgi:tRNA(His) 5'-end guanylyltransferase
MAGSKFAYVKNFELPDPLLPGTFMILRLDGHAFHRLVKLQSHGPSDKLDTDFLTNMGLRSPTMSVPSSSWIMLPKMS